MLIGPQNLLSRLTEVRSRIRSSAIAAGRDPAGVTLVAVTKTKPSALIREAAAHGVTDFGENYVQEATDKMAELAGLALTWHFIGALQSNKTRTVAQNFSWVHGIDRLKIAQRLSEHRPFHAAPLNVCIQVELEPEPAKAGVAPGAVGALASRISELPRLKLRGLMCIPPPLCDPERQAGYFRQMIRLLEELNAQGHGMDTLSMGMSEDFEIAIRAGATMVRVGSAIFGAR